MYISDLITVFGYLHMAGFKNHRGINFAKCTSISWLYAGTVMMSCYQASRQHRAGQLVPNKPTWAWIRWSCRWSNSLELCYQCKRKIWHCSGKFDQHLSLYCDAVKPKLQTGTGYWFLFESWDIISNMHLKACSCILIPFKYRGDWEKWYVQFVWN